MARYNQCVLLSSIMEIDFEKLVWDGIGLCMLPHCVKGHLNMFMLLKLYTQEMHAAIMRIRILCVFRTKEKAHLYKMTLFETIVLYTTFFNAKKGYNIRLIHVRNNQLDRKRNICRLYYINPHSSSFP